MTKIKDNYTIDDIILAFKNYNDTLENDIINSYEYIKKYLSKEGTKKKK